MPRSYTSRQVRREGLAFALTSRDLDILKLLARVRVAPTRAVHRRLFGGASLQRTQRRLQGAFHAGLVGRIQPLIQVGNGTSSDTVHYLDTGGRTVLAEEAYPIPTYAPGAQIGREFLAHAVDLTEFRISLELAIAQQNTVVLGTFVSDFELKARFNGAMGKDRYRLCGGVIHPLTQQRHVVYPDALFILQATSDPSKQRLYLVEADRGTEGLAVVRSKVIGYNVYYQQRLFQQWGAFSRFLLLIQTSSPRRAANILRELAEVEGGDLVWVTSRDQVSEHTLLTAPIWRDVQGKQRALIKTGSTSAVPVDCSRQT